MRILATPEARSWIRERGGLLFVRPRRHGLTRGGFWTLATSTELPEGALDYQRFEARDFFVFLPPGWRAPHELVIEMRGRLRRRLEAFWNGCAFVM